MPAIPHPSFLELDKLSVGAGSKAAEQHVADCAECSAHLGRVGIPVPVPEWVERTQRSGWRLWGWGWTWQTIALAGTCAATLIAVGLGYGGGAFRPVNDAYQIKGTTPGIAVYIKRGDQIETWDGKQPLRTGDLLRLQVAPEGFRHIKVDSPSSPNAHLFDGDLPQTIDFLPVSWRVDDKAGPEVLDITLSSPGATPWHTRLLLPKSGKP